MRIKLFFLCFVLILVANSMSIAEIKARVDENGKTIYFNTAVKKTAPSRRAAVQPATYVQKAQYQEPSFLIDQISMKYEVDPDLVKAVIQVESSFNPSAVSHAGAMGMMQLMPATAERFGVRNIYDPADNIEGGVQYLRFLLDLFDNDLELAVAAYNAGEGAVQRHKGVPNYPETKNYVKRVMHFYGNDDYQASEASKPIYRYVNSDGITIFTTEKPDNYVTLKMDLAS